jgi:hypothetical protein
MGKKSKKDKDEEGGEKKGEKKGVGRPKKKAAGSSHKGKKLNKWSPADMKWAITEHKRDKANLPKSKWRSIAWFSNQTGISKSTLWYRFSGKVSGSGHQSGGKNKSKSLPAEVEDAIADRAGMYLPSTSTLPVPSCVNCLKSLT